MKNMKTMVVAMAVVFSGFGYVGGRAMTPTEIKPATITVAATEVEEHVEETVEEPEIEIEVEEEKEEVQDIVKMLNDNGSLDGFVVYTATEYHYEMYLPDLIEWINSNTANHLSYADAFGRWQVTNDDTGKAVRITIMREVED